MAAEVSMELFQAHHQWATRPDDERFKSLEALYEATKKYADQAIEKMVPVNSIRTEAVDGEVIAIGRHNNPAKLTHYAFGQLSTRVGAPASYLRELPATLAAQNLNHGLKQYADKTDEANVLFHRNGMLMMRSINSDIYARIWNWEIAERLMQLRQYGWDVAKPTIRQIDDKLPLYASDHDMFAFLMADDVVIEQPINPTQNQPLHRGLIASNSEVGAGALKFLKFWFNEMCGNHIIWGATDVEEISVRHVGNARERWSAYQYEMRKYLEGSVSDDEAKIEAAVKTVIGETKEQVLDKLFNVRSLGLSRKTLTAGYDAVIEEQDGSPRTIWGMVQGLTRYSQSTPFADERTAIDRGAGKIMDLDF